VKFVLGFAGALVTTALCFLVPGDGSSISSAFAVVGCLGALTLVAHVVRFAIHLFGRAAGGRGEDARRKKWWRYL
jgi:hypothetical protein